MAIRTTIWRPDTCGCVLEYQWDDSLTEAQRKHTIKSIIPCLEHTKTPDDIGKVIEDEVVLVHQENVNKNLILSLALDTFPKLVEVKDGNVVLKETATFDWSISGKDEARVISAEFKGVTLTTVEKATLQSLVDVKSGVGKSIIL